MLSTLRVFCTQVSAREHLGQLVVMAKKWRLAIAVESICARPRLKHLWPQGADIGTVA